MGKGKKHRQARRAQVSKGSLGRGMWDRLHGKANRPVAAGFVEWGWRWQPVLCLCKSPHYLDQSLATKFGRT